MSRVWRAGRSTVNSNPSARPAARCSPPWHVPGGGQSVLGGYVVEDGDDVRRCLGIELEGVNHQVDVFSVRRVSDRRGESRFPDVAPGAENICPYVNRQPTRVPIS